MRNGHAHYFVVDAGQRNLLLIDATLEIATFVQRNLMDTRLGTVSAKRWRELEPQISAVERKETLALRGVQLSNVPADAVSEITVQKRDRALLLAHGYFHLLWYANAAGERYMHTASIDYNDLPLLDNHRTEFVALYARSKGVSLEQAAKQIEFDEQSLRAMVMRRKEIIWTYEAQLLALTSMSEIEAWKKMLQNDTVNVGAV